MISFLTIIMPILSAVIITVLGFLFNTKLKKMDIAAADKQLALKLQYETESKERDDKNKENLDELYNRLSDRMSEVEGAIGALTSIVKAHVSDGSFRDEFENDIMSAHNVIITGDGLIPSEYKTIMSRWSELIAAFGLKYSRSNERKLKGVKLKIYLKDRKKELMSALTGIINSKKIENKDSKGKRLMFSDYIHAINLHGVTERLFDRLLLNGMNTEELKTLFSEYLIEFDTEFISAIADYTQMKDYSLMNYERKALDD